jgi:hypothetical protein
LGACLRRCDTGFTGMSGYRHSCVTAEIDSEYWFDELERPTVRMVIKHFRRTSDVDLSYPVILEPGNRVMDGMHRVARALLEGRTATRVRRFRELPEPDYADAVPLSFRTDVGDRPGTPYSRL